MLVFLRRPTAIIGVAEFKYNIQILPKEPKTTILKKFMNILWQFLTLRDGSTEKQTDLKETMEHWYLKYPNHISTFNNPEKAESTTPYKQIWKLKRSNVAFDLKWSIVGKASSYNSISGICHLCLLEKTTILMSNCNKPLNKRTEIMNTCRHRRKHLLSSFGPAV